MNTKKARKLNLAMQGGGSHGAFGWGVLDRLLEDGRFELDGVSATSAGAMNAAVYAYGKMTGGPEQARALLEQFWSKVSETGRRLSPVRRTLFDDWMTMIGVRESVSYVMFDAMTRVLSPYQLNPFNYHPLRTILEETIDFEQLRQCTCTQLSIAATNVKTGGVRIFRNGEVSADAIVASACLPMLFQAIEIEGEFYWDGGYMGNPALYPLIYNTESNDILIVHINPIVRDAVPRTASDIMNRVNEISFNSSLIRELRAISFVTKLIDEDWIRPEYKDRLRRVNIHAVRSDAHMSSYTVASKFETDWPFLTKLRDAGRMAASAWLDSASDSVGKESSVDLARDYLS
ncbi:MAG: patatin-like phospholipase family protein [Sphingomonadales bacterium]|nr:MAG: patatin-like phospholipase family protein [Sphingomonadales bacterium]